MCWIFQNILNITKYVTFIFNNLIYIYQVKMLTKIGKFAMNAVKSQFITITSRAQSRIQDIINKKADPEIIGVKVSLTKKGCNGLTYAMDYVKSHNKFDEIIQKPKFKLIIDSKALMALVGTEMDFVESQLGTEFVFNNPNEKGRCGCGQSFHL